MQYLRPFTYFISKPGGGRNLAYGSLALLTGLVIPIIGQLVVLGYASIVTEDLEHDPDLTDHRDFKFEKLTEYITRGIWPLLMQLIILCIGMIAIAINVAAGVALYVYIGDGTLAIIIAGTASLLCLSLLSLLVWPMTLHAQLSRGFHLRDAVGFTASFLKTMGLRLIVALIISSFISFWLSLFGMMFCIIGIYPAVMIQMMAQEHFSLQLYRIYLEEGGEPIHVARED